MLSNLNRLRRLLAEVEDLPAKPPAKDAEEPAADVEPTDAPVDDAPEPAAKKPRPKSAVDSLRDAREKLDTIPGDDVPSAMRALTEALTRMDEAMTALGRDTRLGRAVLDAARELDGVEVSYTVSLRASVEAAGRFQPSALKWTMSLPELPDKELARAVSVIDAILEELGYVAPEETGEE